MRSQPNRKDLGYLRERFTLPVPGFIVKFYRHRYQKNKEKYQDLERNLVSSRMPVSVPRYMAISLFYPLILLPLFFVVSLGVSRFIGIWYANYTGSFRSLLPIDIYTYVRSPISISIQRPDVFIIEVGSLIVLTVLMFYIARKIILFYPVVLKAQRKSKIDSALPHVVNIMLGMSKGGTPLLEIIKTIAEERSITGEVGKEFGIIFREVEVFHKDLISAMRYVANTTPSQKLSEFLEDLISVVEGGGKLSEFLEFKSAHYLEERERFHEIFINSLEIMAEVYVAVFVVAPLFTLIVFVVMGLLGENIETVSKIIVYAYIPIGGLMFTWLVKSMVEEEKPGWLTRKTIPVFLKARIINNGRSSQFKRKRGIVALFLKTFRFLQRVLSPRFIFRNPEYTLILTVPISVAVGVYAYYNFNMRIETILGGIFLISSFPYIVIFEYRSYRLRKFENDLPEFLKQLGSLNESGLTLVNALKVISTSDLGSLTKEVRNIRKDIEWGRLITEAFERFDERIGSPVVSKVVSILVKALEATDNVKAAIFTAASDAEIYLDFRKRVATEMFVYTVIVYITFGVFLFTVVVLNQNFISVFGNITAPSELTGIYFSFPDPFKLTNLFYHATLLNGLFSGIVAGVMGAGSIRAGLKHSLIMVVVTILVFKYFLGVGF